MNSFLFKSTLTFFFHVFILFSANSQCSFGNENPGFPGPSSYGANYLLGVKYNCPNAMTIDALHLYGLGTNSNVQMAIYEDNMGVPGNLLAASALGVVGTGDISLAIPPTSLNAGDYWIMAIYDNIGGTNGHTNYTTTTSKTVYYTSLTFGSPIPTNASGFTNYCCQDFQYWATGSAQSTDNRVECAPFTWIDGNTYTSDTNSVTYTYIGGSSAGCDSVVTLDLTVIHPSLATDTRTECAPFTWIDGNVYTADNDSATYTILGGSAEGCDSTITLDLTIQTIDVTTTVNELTITANLSGANYQWINCDNGNAPLQGDTNQSYSATVNGNYACIIDDNGCVDTSDCISITTVGLDVLNSYVFHLYPNPAKDQLFVKINSESLKYEIRDVHGKKVCQGTEKIIDVSTLAPGSYFIQLVTEEGAYTRRWSKH